jgi:hypothetical protein
MHYSVFVDQRPRHLYQNSFYQTSRLLGGGAFHRTPQFIRDFETRRLFGIEREALKAFLRRDRL